MPGKEEPKEVQNKPSSNKLLIIVLVLVVLLGAGVAGVYFNLIPLPHGKGPVKKKEKPVLYSMPTFLVNLADPGAKRYLKVTMVLDLSSHETAKECSAMDPQLRDLILTVLSNQQSDNIVTPSEKLALKEQLMQSVDHVLTKGKVLAIYFTDFLIQ
ncbi:MAG: flagellar basal body-associated FliL family protein [Deltaproteobacteria bacterium]|nr:flagellar basal body-associated FliL family protein [Deltaproteobacteria bacterium]